MDKSQPAEKHALEAKQKEPDGVVNPTMTKVHQQAAPITWEGLVRVHGPEAAARLAGLWQRRGVQREGQPP